ncbi:MAG TPA: hypothetical protein PLX69_06705 [Leptospiraceae bacterium]|nr:hypothetical protein [Leptospiraceae bacterium]HRG74228.1 hypothetical protein [Leptospiraceae bacterium]
MKKLLVTVNEKRYEVEVEILEDDEVVYVPKTYSTTESIRKEQTIQHPHLMDSGNSKVIVAPMTGLILEVRVKVGQAVKLNDIVIVMEAMKMKVNIMAPVNGGIIEEILVKEKDTVEQSKVMIRFE